MDLNVLLIQPQVEIVGKTMQDLATACGLEWAEALYAMYAEELLQGECQVRTL